MRFTKLLMSAGLAVAMIGGVAAADPCGPNEEVVVQPEAAYDYAPPVVVRPEVAPRVIVRDGWYGRRWERPYRYRREIRREIRRDERGYGRTARSYRHGSRW